MNLNKLQDRKKQTVKQKFTIIFIMQINGGISQK